MKNMVWSMSYRQNKIQTTRCNIRNPDGSCSILLSGDNHFGYLGYRWFMSAITNNGAIDRVATDWKAQQWEFFCNIMIL
jgi:hypothetical protein